MCSGGGEQDPPSSGVLILGVVQFLSTGIFTYNLSVYMVRVGELNTHSSLAFRVSGSPNPNTNQGDENPLRSIILMEAVPTSCMNGL